MIASVQRSPLRVLITVVQHYVDCAGGSSRLAYDEALHLRDLGHEVWMLAPAANDQAPEHEFSDGLHWLRYRHQKRRAIDPRRISSHQAATVETLRRFTPLSFDVVHGHSPLQYLAACSLLGTNTRKCFSVHSPMYEEFQANAKGGSWRQLIGLPWAIRVERQCLLNSDWVNAFSNFTLNALKLHHGPVADSIRVLPGWTDFDRFHVSEDRGRIKQRLGWRSDVPVLFTLRRLVPRMGLDRLVKAAGALHRRGYDFELAIGGSGPARKSLEALVAREGMQDRIKFLGHVPDEDLPSLYAACDAFVLPTAELECFGIIAVEALASERPVLATPVAAIPEIMDRIEPKWMSRSAGVDAIADLLADFLAGRLPTHEANDLRERARTFWDSKHCLARFCDAVLGNGASDHLLAEAIGNGAAK